MQMGLTELSEPQVNDTQSDLLPIVSSSTLDKKCRGKTMMLWPIRKLLCLQFFLIGNGPKADQEDNSLDERPPTLHGQLMDFSRTKLKYFNSR